jgi:hypothetical protein
MIGKGSGVAFVVVFANPRHTSRRMKSMTLVLRRTSSSLASIAFTTADTKKRLFRDKCSLAVPCNPGIKLTPMPGSGKAVATTRPSKHSGSTAWCPSVVYAPASFIQATISCFCGMRPEDLTCSSMTKAGV